MKLKCINDKPLQGNDVAPPLEVGKIYYVEQVHTETRGKGAIMHPAPKHYDVGLISKYNYVTSRETGVTLPNSSVGGVHWCHPSRFEEFNN